MTDMVLHEYAASGNCYKVRLTAAHAGIALDRREYDIMKGETRTPDYLANVSANGRIPVLQVGTRFLPESNAACCYLAHGTPLMPEDRFDRADMLRWLFWEQYHHEPNIATLRFWRMWLGDDGLSDVQRALVPSKQAAGEAALALMDQHLATRDFFVASRFGVADIVLYAYTHLAPSGGFDLAPYANIRSWLERVVRQPGHIPFEKDDVTNT